MTEFLKKKLIMAYVYRHIRTDTNQPFYIGASAKDFDYKCPTRAKDKCKRNNLWKEVVLTTSYEIEIILTDLTKTEAFEKEKEFIKIYGRLNNGTGVLTNKNDGGEGRGQVYTNERRIKISEISKTKIISKETREKMAAKLRGRPHPQWQKDILSKAAKGKKIISLYKPVLQYSMNMEYINEFESITEAAKISSAKAGNIVKAAQNKRNQAGGYIWKYK